MRILIALIVLCCSFASEARAWSVGANLGVSFINPDDGETYTIVSWPSYGILTALGTPGLRLGFTGRESAHEIYVDTGFLSFSVDESSFSTLQLTANYQYNFAPSGTGPYFTVGGGLQRTSMEDFIFFDGDDMGATFGAGLGVRHRMGHGFGTLRGEIRFDHQVEGEEEIFVDANVISVKLGFDVWGS